MHTSSIPCCIHTSPQFISVRELGRTTELETERLKKKHFVFTVKKLSEKTTIFSFNFPLGNICSGILEHQRKIEQHIRHQLALRQQLNTQCTFSAFSISLSNNFSSWCLLKIKAILQLHLKTTKSPQSTY